MQARAIGVLMLAALVGGPAFAAEPTAVIGRKVADFTLRDFRGQAVSLVEAAPDKLVVVAVLGTECPLCKLYAPRLAELATAYEPKGVVFLGLDANRQDAVTEMVAYARVHGINFPILKDLNQVVADHLGAMRTPEVFVLDRERVIRYWGRIDDQYGIEANKRYQKREPQQRPLAEALDALLAGKPVEKPETQAIGCLIGRDRQPAANSTVTYTKHIAPILNANCVSCHRPGEIAPFSLTNYEEAAGWAEMIDEVVQEQRMPPWHADGKFGHFRNDARLSDAAKQTIAKWVAAGAPQGDPADLPAPPKFTDGWAIADPDQVIYMRDEPFKVQATGVLEYQIFVVDPKWTEDKWITAVEARPGNRSVVHHILLFVKTPDGGVLGLGSGNDYLAAYAPGIRPEPLAEGLARRVPAGSKLIFQMHYTPNGSAQEDRSYCGFVFTDAKKVKKEVQVASAVNFVFRIPPNNGDFPVNARYVFSEDKLLLMLMPHMHLRGKAFRYTATYPDGQQEVLLDVPRYDFGWQTNYRLAEPKPMPAGTRLECQAHFDNSADNPSNPNSKTSVRFGDQTFEEMMIGFFEATPAHQDLQQPDLAKQPRTRVEQFNVIMAATKGEPDDNVRVGAQMAMLDPEIFAKYGEVLGTMVPQLDRLCITAVKREKVVELMGPTVRLRLRQAAKPAEESPTPPRETLGSPLPSVPTAGESLAEYATADQVIVNSDLSKAKGTLIETMIRRGAKSSLHVPVEIRGARATVNFWSGDADAFPPAAQALLTTIARSMAAGRPVTTASK